MSDVQKNEKKSSKNNIIIILFAVIILLLITVLVFVVSGKNSSSVSDDAPVVTESQHIKDGILMYDSAAVALSEDDLQDKYNKMVEKAKEGTMALEFKHIAQSSDGKNFTCSIGNSLKNNYDMFINIYKDNTLSEQLLLTGLIPPGQGIESFESEIQLEPGEYEAMLVLTQVEDDHSTLHAQLNVVLTLQVAEY